MDEESADRPTDNLSSPPERLAREWAEYLQQILASFKGLDNNVQTSAEKFLAELTPEHQGFVLTLPPNQRESFLIHITQQAQAIVEDISMPTGSTILQDWISYGEELLRDLADIVRKVEETDKYGRMPKKEKAQLLLKGFLAAAGKTYKIDLGDYKRWPTPEVDLERELDCERLHYAKDQYEIELDPFEGVVHGGTYLDLWPDRPAHITRAAAEDLRALGYLPGKILFNKYYRLRVRLKDKSTDVTDTQRWLPVECRHKITPINDATLRSSDLLDAILVVYLVKGAQNRDEEAVEKLYSLYEVASLGTANAFWGRNKHLKRDDVRNTARRYLRLLLEGDDPLNVPRFVASEDDDLTPELSSSWGHGFYQVVTKVLPDVTRSFVDCTKAYDRRVHNGELSYEQAVRELHGPYMDLHVDWMPVSWLCDWEVAAGEKGFYRFNPDLYTPDKGTHLTTWLFGRKGASSTGTLWRRLRRHYEHEGKWARKATSAASLSSHTQDDEDEEERPIERFPDGRVGVPGEEEWELVQAMLNLYQRNCGIKERDIEIISVRLRAKLGGEKLTHKQIAKLIPRSPGERQVKRILAKFYRWRDENETQIMSLAGN